MKIIVVHGDDVEKSRARLQKFIDSAKKRGWNIERLNPDKDNIQEALQAEMLFSSGRLFLIENPVKMTKDVLAWLKSAKDRDETIVIYHTNTLTKTFLNSLPAVEKEELFENPKLIWKLLDAFYPGNAKTLIPLYKGALEADAPEFVFAMLSRHVKDMYHVLIDVGSMSAPDWRKGKLESQAKKFGTEKLKNIISQMAEIDAKSKTSKLTVDEALDFLILTELE